MKVWWLIVGCLWMVDDCRAVGHSVMVLGIGGWLVEVGVWGLVIGCSYSLVVGCWMVVVGSFVG